MLADLISSITLLLSLSLVYSLVVRHFYKQETILKVLSGILFGGIAILGMVFTIEISSGVITDFRTVVLSVAALFGGPVVAIISVALAGGFRLFLGGAGALVGLDIVIVSACIGLAYRYGVQKGWAKINVQHLFVFGLLVQLSQTLLFQSLPTDLADLVTTTVALPLLLFFTPATVFLGLLLKNIQDHQSTVLALKESESQLLHHFSNTPLASIYWDKNFYVKEWNKRAETIFGYSADEAIGKHATELIVKPTKKARTDQFLKEILKNNGVSRSSNENVRKDGSTIICDWYDSALLDEAGKLIGVASLCEDVTERKQAEAALKIAANVATHSNDGIFITDADAKIVNVNDAFLKMLGFSREEVISQNPRMFQSGRQSAAFYNQMWATLQEKGSWKGEIWNRRKNGEIFPEHGSITVVRNDQGEVTHYVAVFTDIADVKTHQKELQRVANFDLLTDLPNRTLLNDRLSQSLAHCARQGTSLTLLFMDLDGFKQVNDQYSHSLGDQLLVRLAKRMQRVLREGDTLARVGGDEFVAVLVDLDDSGECVPIIDRLLLAASEPVTINRHSLSVSASIGVTFYPLDQSDSDGLIRHAEQAMYIAKDDGKNGYHVFDIARDHVVKTRRESLMGIRDALDNNQFVLHYQPKIDMMKGTVIGVEALVRWQHPELGLLAPAKFLPVLDDHEMAVELGDWVLDAALSQIASWHREGLHMPSVSVNVAPIQIEQDDFVDKIQAALAKNPSFDPSCLELEVLESNILRDLEYTSTVMKRIMKLGVNFALDDFGTGYSSLTYIRSLPANLVKIDQSFVRDMLKDPDDAAIVESVILLAKAFKRSVIAEGVETVEHGAALIKLGCNLAQGYGIAKPMPAANMPEWIANWQPDESWQE